MQLLLEKVSKVYRGQVRALHRFELSLKPGVLGLLGPNGAGKSTLMRIVATITRPSSGRVLAWCFSRWRGYGAKCNCAGTELGRFSHGSFPNTFFFTSGQNSDQALLATSPRIP
jgi:ABC-type phosphate/phosphonate transport system ATPase subunit